MQIVIDNYFKSECDVNTSIRQAFEKGFRIGVKKGLSAQPERAIKDCRNCKHGNYNDHWNTYFCYHSDDCNDFDKWEPSEEPEIIRCKGCKHYKAKQGSLPWNNSRRYCNRSVTLAMNPDDFCSFAERRTDEQTVSE